MPTDYKALTRRWFEEVWNQRRPDTVHELLAPESVGHGLVDPAAGAAAATGPAAFFPFFERFIGAFPNIRVVVEDVVGEGLVTVARLRAEGTHGGHTLGFAATHRPVRFTALVWIRWQDGRIAEAWNEVDLAGMLKQVGAT